MTRFSPLYVFSIFVKIILAQESIKYNEAPTVAAKKIKGEQYVRQSMVAKILGGPIPRNILDLLEGNITAANIPKAEDNKKPPFLVTDNVKTTVTRVAIPLSLRYMDSEWYRSTLKKFLTRNRMKMSRSDAIESADNVDPPLDFVIYKLKATVQLRNNLIALFGQFLQNTLKLLPPDHHPSLSLIYHFLRLRRFPVIGILECLAKVQDESKASAEIFHLIFTELWEVVPKYILSSVTLWLESLQDESVISDYVLSTYCSTDVLLDDIPIHNNNTHFAHEPLLFARNTVTNIQKDHEAILGKPLAAVLSAVSSGSITMDASLFTLLFLNIPLNFPSVNEDDLERHLLITVAEANAFKQATLSLKDQFYRLPLMDIFKTILLKISKLPNFQGKSKYEKFVQMLEPPTEDFLFNHF